MVDGFESGEFMRHSELCGWSNTVQDLVLSTGLARKVFEVFLERPILRFVKKREVENEDCYPCGVRGGTFR